MAAEVGTAFVSILPSFRGFSSKLKAELAGELRTIDPVVGAAGRRAGETFGSNMHSSLSGFVTKMGSLLKTGLVVGTTAAVAGLGALTGFGLKSAAALEQTTIGIQALVGSTQEATKFIGELQQFAAKTPFQFEGVADASRRILAFGQSVGIAREQVIPTLTTIGDLVSVLGGTQENIDAVIRAFGQIASKGRLMGGEVLQLSEALPGFNVNAAVAAKLGLSVADSLKLQESGAIDATTAITGILEGMAQFKGAAGAMEKQSQTLLGVWSTFKDTFAIGLTNAFQPVIPAIKGALTDLTPVLGEAINQLAPKLGMLLQAFLPIIGVFSQITTPILVPILDALAKIVPILQPALQMLGEALASIVDALVPLVIPIAQFVAALANGLAPVILTLVPQIADLAKPFGDILIALIPLIPPISELLVLFLQLQSPLIKLTAIALEFLTIKGLVPLVNALAQGFTTLLAPVAQAVAVMTDLENWPKIFESILTGAEQKLGALGDVFAQLPGKILGFLSGLPSMLGQLALNALNAMLYTVGFGIGAILRSFAELPAKIGEAVTALWGLVTSLFTKGAEDTKQGFFIGIDKIVTFARDLPGRVGAALAELPGKIAQLAVDLYNKSIELGANIINGAIQGIKNTIGNVGSVLKDGFNSALSGLKKGLGIGSPSKVYAEVGADTIAGYVQGVEQATAKARAATLGALGPAAVASPAGVPASGGTVNVTSSDPLINMVMDRIRETVRAQFGGNVTVALGTT